MNIGMRIGAWSCGSTPTARDYVQDGLVAMWDGIENAGWGVHSDYGMVDLLGSSISLPKECGEKGIAGAVKSSGPLIYELAPILRVEVCFSMSSHANACYVKIGNDGNIIHFGLIEWGSIASGVNWNSNAGFRPSLLVGGKTVHLTSGECYINGVKPSFIKYSGGTYTQHGDRIDIGYGGGFDFKNTGFVLHGIRLYNRVLSVDEIAANYAVDKARFNLS